MDLGTLQTALVVAPNWVGDVVMATPAFRALRQSLPETHITLLVRAYASKILAGAPWFDRVVEMQGSPRSLATVVRTARALRRLQPDLAVIFPNSFRSALTVWLGGARHRVGYRRDGRSVFLTSALPRPKREGAFAPMYMADYYLALLADLGIEARSGNLELFVTDSEEERMDAVWARHGVGADEQVVALNPGAAWGSSKCWPPDRFARTGDLLAERHGVRVAVLAGPGEEEVQGAIVKGMKGPAVALTAGDVPLDLLKPLVRRLALLVTNDTGPRHYANAFSIPAVVVLGPTDPAYTRNPSERAVVLQSERDCVPCHRKTCPRGHECMLDITPEQVAEAAGPFLSGRARNDTEESM